MHLLKNDVLRALALYYSGTRQDVFKVSLWLAVVLAFGRACGRHVGGLHLCLVHLDMGKGHPRTLYARRPLQ